MRLIGTCLPLDPWVRVAACAAGSTIAEAGTIECGKGAERAKLNERSSSQTQIEPSSNADSACKGVAQRRQAARVQAQIPRELGRGNQRRGNKEGHF